jgi:hypothetical protein
VGSVPPSLGPTDPLEHHRRAVLEQTARAFERSAQLADQHAERHQIAGDAAAAAYERRIAVRARAAAQRARDRAARAL